MLAVRTAALVLSVMVGVAGLEGSTQARSKPAAATPTAPPAAEPVAEPTRPKPDDAASHLTRARELFQEQKFAEAGDELQRAYAIEAKPLFLFNAGQAYRKGEKRKEALAMYQRYLEVAPDGPLAAEARGYSTDLQAMLKAEANLQDVNLRLESEKSKSEAIEQTLKDERRKRWYRHPAFIVGMSLVGVVVVVVAGTWIGLELQGKTDGGNVRISF